MIDNDGAPSRALMLTMKLGADDRAEMADVLRSMADRIEAGDMGGIGMHGAPHSGAVYELLTDPTMTHERYFRELQAYLRGKENARG